ncbi:MAG: prefoldin subunit alpha [Candidatus Heimdallarchaeota archaeon]|nr:prefoldin subunit alpha [Candidatus Heimdallarchaeota archaeon]
MAEEQQQQEEARAELTRISSTLQQFEQYSQQLANQLDTLGQYLAELQRSRQTLKNLESEAEGEETLIELGGGVSLRAKVLDSQNVFYTVGSGVTLNKPLEEAIEGLDERIDEQQKQKQSLTEQLVSVYQQMQALEQRGQQLLQQIQGPAKPSYDTNLPGMS